MDKYFYSIEPDRKGNTYMHLYAYMYHNDADEDDKCITFVSCTFLYINIAKVKELVATGAFKEYVDTNVQYVDTMTKKEALLISQQFFDGYAGSELSILDVAEDTPYGNYWSRGGCLDNINTL